MNQLDAFLEHYRRALLAHIDAGAPAAPAPHASRAFVTHVLDAFGALPCAERARPVQEWERTLWWTLMVLDEIADAAEAGDDAAPIGGIHPALRADRQRLAARAPLPRGRFAARPGERVPSMPGGSPGAGWLRYAAARVADDGTLDVRIPFPPGARPLHRAPGSAPRHSGSRRRPRRRRPA